MNERVTNAVTRCLEIDVDFYRELLVFLMKKHAKIMTDDLEWLTESLNKEQAYLMKSKSLEEKREELFRGLGLQGRKPTTKVPPRSTAECRRLRLSGRFRRTENATYDVGI